MKAKALGDSYESLQARTAYPVPDAAPNAAHSKRRRELPMRILFHVVVILGAVLMVYPIVWLLASSLKPTDEIFTTIASIIPRHVTLAHYLDGWSGFGGVTFATFYRNTFIYAGLGTVFTIFIATITAFGFARVSFPGSRVWFGVMLLTLMIPVQIQIIPQYIIFDRLHMVNTFYPLLLPRLLGQAGQAFFIFMIVQFIRGIPAELDEAAEIDGAGKLRVFGQVILPLVKPPIVTTAIFSFYWTWGDFLGPLIYLNNPNLFTVSVALRDFADPSGTTQWGQIFAMSFLSLVPVIAIFIAFQRYIVEGISTTGMKG
jgi:ABC-type glycerol-3-phosphate transport system permease component